MLVGKAVKNRKIRVDEVLSFSMKYLMDNGILEVKDFNIHKCQWTRGGKPTDSICYQIFYDKAGSPEFIKFSYTSMNRNTGDKKSYKYLVKLVTTPCHFGGKRWWFICPLEKNGILCGRRCSILYLPDTYSYFGCRICYELTYESRQRHRQGSYEYFEKPYNKIKQAYEDLKKAKNIDEQLELWKIIDENKKIIDAYDRRFLKNNLKD